MRKRFIFLALLTACAPLKAPEQTLPDTCNRASLTTYLDQPVTSLETVLLLQPVRVIRPNQAVTKDYREDRLNIHLNADDVIVRLSCG
ncbi:MAG: I78 family peptidase inhibitor [Pseudomonadota bacterium]